MKSFTRFVFTIILSFITYNLFTFWRTHSQWDRSAAFFIILLFFNFFAIIKWVFLPLWNFIIDFFRLDRENSKNFCIAYLFINSFITSISLKSFKINFNYINIVYIFFGSLILTFILFPFILSFADSYNDDIEQEKMEKAKEQEKTRKDTEEKRDDFHEGLGNIVDDEYFRNDDEQSGNTESDSMQNSFSKKEKVGEIKYNRQSEFVKKSEDKDKKRIGFNSEQSVIIENKNIKIYKYD